jgi:hypothetical protein
MQRGGLAGAPGREDDVGQTRTGSSVELQVLIAFWTKNTGGSLELGSVGFQG